MVCQVFGEIVTAILIDISDPKTLHLLPNNGLIFEIAAGIGVITRIRITQAIFCQGVATFDDGHGDDMLMKIEADFGLLSSWRLCFLSLQKQKV